MSTTRRRYMATREVQASLVLHENRHRYCPNLVADHNVMAGIGDRRVRVWHVPLYGFRLFASDWAAGMKERRVYRVTAQRIRELMDWLDGKRLTPYDKATR